MRRRENSEKGDSAVTTGTEGTNNPVMAGKKVVKVRSQEQAEEDRKAAKIAQAEEDNKEAENLIGQYGIKQNELEDIYDLIAEEHPDL